jgi:hypothetical protein
MRLGSIFTKPAVSMPQYRRTHRPGRCRSSKRIYCNARRDPDCAVKSGTDAESPPSRWKSCSLIAGGLSFTRSAPYLVSLEHADQPEEPTTTPTATVAIAIGTFRGLWICARPASVYPVRREPLQRPTSTLRVVYNGDRRRRADRPLTLRALAQERADKRASRRNIPASFLRLGG